MKKLKIFDDKFYLKENNYEKPKQIHSLICNLIKRSLNNSKNFDGTIVDFGSGNGELLFNLQKTFPKRTVVSFELNKSDTDPRTNALHLDCCFQPIGKNQALLYRGGFKNEDDVQFMLDYFGAENIIELNHDEMYHMTSNVFSISTNVIVSEKRFSRLNNELRKRGFTVEEIQFAEVGKMSGLLRCSTLPLRRTYNE